MDENTSKIYEEAWQKIENEVVKLEKDALAGEKEIDNYLYDRDILRYEAEKLEARAKWLRPSNRGDWLNKLINRKLTERKQNKLFKEAGEYRKLMRQSNAIIKEKREELKPKYNQISKLKREQDDLLRQAREWEKGDKGRRPERDQNRDMEQRIRENEKIIFGRENRDEPEPPTREHNREEIRDTTRPGDNQREIDTSDNNPAPPTREDSERDPREDAWLRDIQNRADEAKTERSEPADTNSPAREDGEVSRENEPGEVTWRDDLKNKIDEARAESRSMEEFKERLEAQGIEVRERGEEIISFRHPDVKTNIRGATLGDEYSRENIERDLEQNRENPREDSREEPGREDRQQDQQQEPTREETRDTSIPSVRQWEEPTSTERDNPLPPGYQEPGINRLSESRTESRFEYTDTHPFEIMLQAKARERENPSPENRQEYLERREAWQTYHDERLAEINGERDRDHDRSPDREDTEDRDHSSDREDTEDRDNDRDMDRER